MIFSNVALCLLRKGAKLVYIPPPIPPGGIPPGGAGGGAGGAGGAPGIPAPMPPIPAPITYLLSD